MGRKLEKVLYAEDEQDIRTLVSISLGSTKGLQLQVCVDGQEVLGVMEDYQPQLFLLDVMMPKLSGPELLARIREFPEFKSTPVIFMTARVQPQEVERYKQLGVAEVITKPFDPVTLSNIINEVWQRESARMETGLDA